MEFRQLPHSRVALGPQKPTWRWTGWRMVATTGSTPDAGSVRYLPVSPGTPYPGALMVEEASGEDGGLKRSSGSLTSDEFEGSLSHRHAVGYVAASTSPSFSTVPSCGSVASCVLHVVPSSRSPTVWEEAVVLQRGRLLGEQRGDSVARGRTRGTTLGGNLASVLLEVVRRAVCGQQCDLGSRRSVSVGNERVSETSKGSCMGNSTLVRQEPRIRGGSLLQSLNIGRMFWVMRSDVAKPRTHKEP